MRTVARLVLWTIAALPLDAGAAPEEPRPVEEAEQLLELRELLDQVVVTAAKEEQRASQAPAIVETITAEEIAARGYQSVGQALRSVAGFARIDDLVNFNVGVRGIYADPSTPSDVLKVMINGQPVALRPMHANPLGAELIPIAAVERIEVIRGPASALYGGNAFLGVVNVITRDPQSVRGGGPAFHQGTAALETSATQTAPSGPALAGGAAAMALGASERFGYLAAAAASFDDRSGLVVPGLDDIVTEDLHERNPELALPRGFPSPGPDSLIRRTYHLNPISRDDRERLVSAYARLSYRLDAGELALDGSLQHADRYGEFQSFSVLSHLNRIVTSNAYARLRFASAPIGGLTLTGSVAFTAGGPGAGDRLVDPLKGTLTKTRDFWSRALDLSAEAHFQDARAGRFTLGVDITLDRERLLRLTETNAVTGVSLSGADPGTRQFNSYGAYLQWLWSPVQALTVALGTRADRNTFVDCDRRQWTCLGARPDTTRPSPVPGGGELPITNRGAGQFSNRAALVYTLPWGGSYAKLIYGTSFKPPSPFQLYHEPLSVSWSTVGDPTLKPESASTLELLLGTTAIEGVSLTLGAFRTQVDDLVVVLKETSLARTRNADVRVTGAEATSRIVWRSGSAYANVSVLLDSALSPRRRDDEPESLWRLSPLNTTVPVGQYPDFLANAGVTLGIAPPLTANLEVHFVGERRSSLVNTQLNEPLSLKKAYTLPAYVDADLFVSTTGWRPLLGRETVISVGVRGVPGNYVEPGVGGIDIPGRPPRLQIKIEQQL